MTFDVEKLEWCGFKKCLKIGLCLFVLTEYMNVTNRQTDGRTPHDGIGRACIASRGKKLLVYYFVSVSTDEILFFLVSCLCSDIC